MKFGSLFRKNKKPLRCSAVIVAAGSSRRMGSDKIFTSLGDIPVLARTLLAFENCELIDEIVVVTRNDKIIDAADICKKYGINKVSKVILGGSTRTESALIGVTEVRKGAKLIAIHDGARPLVSQEVICRAITGADEHMAAIPVISSVDTLKTVDDNGLVINTVDRTHTVRVQTPQVFDADLIKGALTKAANDGLTLTDDCAAVEMMGARPYTVEGDEDNIKLTSPGDAVLAAAILKDRGDYLADRSRV